ncbi:MAG: hypothetical protein ACREL5_10165 [Gemmatimonadales bacterium]
MIGRFVPGALLLTCITTSLAAQLPLITVPRGALRIDFSGSLNPSDHYWSNGDKLPLGAQFDGSDNAMIRGLDASLGTVLGEPVSGLTLGGITALAAQSRGIGDIGLALGLTSRITIFGTVPILFLRSRVSLAFDPAASRVGLNPANMADGIGTTAGRDLASTFFTKFDEALDSLNTRIVRGDYDADPTTLALAQQTYNRATAVRKSLYSLVADPSTASAVLPTSGDAYGMQLLDQITSLQNTFANQLGVTGFSAPLPLPSAPLTSDNFAALLASPGGFATAPNPESRYTLGDMSAGVAVEVFRHGTSDSASWRALWIRATATFPTGAAADPAFLLDQAAGSRHPSGQVDVIGDARRGHLGARLDLTYRHEWPWSELRRLGAPDEALVPAAVTAAVRPQPGDSIAFTAQPYFAFAPHLALAGTIQYWRRAMSHSTYLSGQAPITATSPDVLDVGSAANALLLGIGISYSNSAPNRDGSPSLPVEAGWSVERTISSGSGIFPVALTTRMYLKVYRSLFTH